MATPSAESLNGQFVDQLIPLELIDEPSEPERETMDPEYLGELSMSISAVGLLLALIVKPVGDRYETVAGHRRLLACRIAGYSPVPCRVAVGDNVETMSMLVHENAFREEVNAVEEARFYQRLLAGPCLNDVDLLCVKVRRRREFVEDRLILLMGDPRVIEALHQKQISIAVARELNKYSDAGRRLLHLDVAINQGASARQVAQWRKEAELQGPVFGPDGGVTPGAGGVAVPTQGFQMQCLFCNSTKHPHLMKLVYLHEPCADIVLDMLGRTEKQQAQ